MKTVYRYELGQASYNEAEMIKGAHVVKAGFQPTRSMISVWAVVDTSVKETEIRAFETVGTGHSIIHTEHARYLDTFMMPDGFHVFHVFEVLPIDKEENKKE